MRTTRALSIGFTVACLLFLCIGVASAQLEVPKVVSGTAVISKSAARAGEPFKLALVLKIDKGWHINSDDPGDEFMFPSVFVLDEAPGFKVEEVVFPKPKTATYEYSDFELRIYEDEAVIGALISAAADLKPGVHKLTGKFKYQACNNTSCIMPQDLPFGISVEVVAAGVETKDVEPELFAKIEFKNKG